jgi:ATP-dependent protease ClpP protease subunit
MPNWNSILKEIALDQVTQNESAFDRVRRKYLKLLAKHTKRNVIAYYSGFLSKKIEGVEIGDEDKNGFMLCIHELDRDNGLDLLLHTPGGDGQATESLVDYLRSMFKQDMRAIVPQIAMSAGTMLACSCKSIVMGKHSSLGPIDPQFGIIPAVALLTEVERAYKEIMADNKAALFWEPILRQIPPSFLKRCEEAVSNSNTFIKRTLAENMFSKLSAKDRNNKIKTVSDMLSNVKQAKAHNTHFQYEECHAAGLLVDKLEDDPVFQDLVLTIHHCYMHTLSNTMAFKIIENSLGRAMVKQQQQFTVMQAPMAAQFVPPPPILLGPGGPT